MSVHQQMGKGAWQVTEENLESFGRSTRVCGSCLEMLGSSLEIGPSHHFRPWLHPFHLQTIAIRYGPHFQRWGALTETEIVLCQRMWLQSTHMGEGGRVIPVPMPSLVRSQGLANKLGPILSEVVTVFTFRSWNFGIENAQWRSVQFVVPGSLQQRAWGGLGLGVVLRWGKENVQLLLGTAFCGFGHVRRFPYSCSRSSGR